jgi:phosphatidylglycerophosphatase A
LITIKIWWKHFDDKVAVHKLIATGFGIGYIKGGGTIASFFTALGLILWTPTTPFLLLALTVFITALGVWSGNVVERYWGKDSYRVVIDEVAGMCVSVLFISISWTTVGAAFVLFRFFDVTKPLAIKKAELLPGGWGVMADDVLAGVYSNVLLQLASIVFANLD